MLPLGECDSLMRDASRGFTWNRGWRNHVVVLNEFGSFMRDGLGDSMRRRKRCWCVAARSGCGLHMRDASRGSTWNRGGRNHVVALNESGSFMRDGHRGSMWWRKRCWCVAARSGCGLHMRDAFRGSTWNMETRHKRAVVLSEFGSSMRRMRMCWRVAALSGCGSHMHDARCRPCSAGAGSARRGLMRAVLLPDRSTWNSETV